MIPRNALPDDAAEWASVPVELERLDPDTPHGCPDDLDEIMEYVRLESADVDDADASRLKFIRTAKLGNTKAWLWEYTESDGEVVYVTVHRKSMLKSIRSLASPNGLNHAQFLLAEYYDEVYWG